MLHLPRGGATVADVDGRWSTICWSRAVAVAMDGVGCVGGAEGREWVAQQGTEEIYTVYPVCHVPTTNPAVVMDDPPSFRLELGRPSIFHRSGRSRTVLSSDTAENHDYAQGFQKETVRRTCAFAIRREEDRPLRT